MTTNPGVTMSGSTAAWMARRGAPIEVGPAPRSPAGPGEIVVRNRAVAVNPIDWIIQVAGSALYRWVRYPFVLGSDLAGDVVEVGPGVSRFRVGDRVLGHAVGAERDRNDPAEGAFREHTVVLATLAAPIPDTLPYERAAVLPLGLSTAACALFQEDHLALAHPTLAPTPTGEVVLVWGGSTSVGANAIQLAVAAGYEVVTTCSPANAGRATALGAARCFDYRSPRVVEDIVGTVGGRRLAGAVAIGTGAARPCADVVGACEGPRVLSIASTPFSFAPVAGRGAKRARLAWTLLRIAGSTVALMARCRRRGIRAKFLNGADLRGNEVSRLIYEEYLPAALAAGRHVAAPEPRVVGSGLAAIQGAMDEQRAGVSATKLVVVLPPARPGG